MNGHCKRALFLLAAMIALTSCGMVAFAETEEPDELSKTDTDILAAYTQVGSIVNYGRYEQDNSTADGREPIEWIVLEYDEQSDQALLISRYGLEARCFSSDRPRPTWEQSEIRAWLNTEFSNNAFTEAERERLACSNISTPDFNGNDGGADTRDRVFLLSREEAETYFDDDRERQTAPTQHAIAKGAWQSYGNKKEGKGCCWWWLRSPGGTCDSASYVDTDGSVDGIIYGSITVGCVRPVILLRLK